VGTRARRGRGRSCSGHSRVPRTRKGDWSRDPSGPPSWGGLAPTGHRRGLRRAGGGRSSRTQVRSRAVTVLPRAAHLLAPAACDRPFGQTCRAGSPDAPGPAVTPVTRDRTPWPHASTAAPFGAARRGAAPRSQYSIRHSSLADALHRPHPGHPGLQEAIPTLFAPAIYLPRHRRTRRPTSQAATASRRSRMSMSSWGCKVGKPDQRGRLRCSTSSDPSVRSRTASGHSPSA
jgi:hypothetical protein